MKDNFSKQSELYSRYRPGYPAALFEYILRHVSGRRLLWDCATGNGQTARELAPYFEKIYATDMSDQQLAHAVEHPSIIYAKESAEQTSLRTGSVDLVTVSQALHWFDFDKFFTEVKRVGNDHSMIAVWIYGLIQITPEIDKLFHQYHFETLKNYYDEERRHVDNGYRDIPFPFRAIETPSFFIQLSWSFEDFEGYLNTSSAVQKFKKLHSDESPVPAFMRSIRPLWPNGENLEVQFPLQLKMGYIH